MRLPETDDFVPGTMFIFDPDCSEISSIVLIEEVDGYEEPCWICQINYNPHFTLSPRDHDKLQSEWWITNWYEAFPGEIRRPSDE